MRVYLLLVYKVGVNGFFTHAKVAKAGFCVFPLRGCLREATPARLAYSSWREVFDFMDRLDLFSFT